MRKLPSQLNFRIMATQAIQFFHKTSKSERTNWLWVVSNDYSGLIGWDRHYDGVKIYSFNQFKGRADFQKKGYVPADPDTVNEVLNGLVQWLSEFIKHAGIQQPAA